MQKYLRREVQADDILDAMVALVTAREGWGRLSSLPAVHQPATAVSLDRLFRAGWSKLQVFCRIDYHLATRALAETAQRAAVFKDQCFSDHAPLTVDYSFTL